MTETDTRPEAIAARLTDAQKRALLVHLEFGYVSGTTNTLETLRTRGLALSYRRITPLGAAVRAVLAKDAP